jgi:hypothetical protein
MRLFPEEAIVCLLFPENLGEEEHRFNNLSLKKQIKYCHFFMYTLNTILLLIALL